MAEIVPQKTKEAKKEEGKDMGWGRRGWRRTERWAGREGSSGNSLLPTSN